MTYADTRPRLSEVLREGTRAAHDAAESSPFVAALLGGALPLSAYTALVAQNHAIYTVLEAAAERWHDDPVAGPFVMDELVRLPHLEADLAQLLGPQWPVRAAELRVPATERYIAHLRGAGTAWPGGFIAHHYVRYLGDLSGGQVIRATIQRIYGADGHRSTGFYVFGDIDKIKPFRDRYRGLLDQARLSDAQRAGVVAEAVTAFDLNRAVFTDLAERHVPVSGSPAG